MSSSRKPFEIAPKQSVSLPESTENLIFAQAEYYFDKANKAAPRSEDGAVYYMQAMTVLETYAGIVGITRDEAVKRCSARKHKESGKENI